MILEAIRQPPSEKTSAISSIFEFWLYIYIYILESACALTRALDSPCRGDGCLFAQKHQIFAETPQWVGLMF